MIGSGLKHWEIESSYNVAIPIACPDCMLLRMPQELYLHSLVPGLSPRPDEK